MVELMTEMLIYLGFAFLLGLPLGYLIWGWGTSARISAARADGAAAARTSVDGSAGLAEQLQESEEERRAQADEIERLLQERDEARAKLTISNAEIVEPIDAGDFSRNVNGPETSSELHSDDDPKTTTFSAVRSRYAEPVEDPSDAEAEPVATENDDTVETINSLDEAEGSTPEVPAGLLVMRPDTVDDLKKIKGVGKVMESVLNEKGIYLFSQLAALSEKDVAWVNDAIDAFPGRIHRDRWVEQAQELHLEKYGRAHDQNA